MAAGACMSLKAAPKPAEEAGPAPDPDFAMIWLDCDAANFLNSLICDIVYRWMFVKVARPCVLPPAWNCLSSDTGLWIFSMLYALATF